jgi:hypothetical protein
MPPQLPRVWNVTPDLLSQHLPVGLSLGQGFIDLEAGDIPEWSVETFVRLAWVSHIIEQPGRVTSNPRDLDAIRSDAHHRIMSLPSSTNVRMDLGMDAARRYECLRLCAVMFSCAVIFPLPTDDHWPLALCRQLRQTMWKCSAPRWRTPYSQALKWCLIIACMTGWEYEHRDDLMRMLRSSCAETDGWQSLRSTCAAFLWSNIACSDGAMHLWCSLFPLSVRNNPASEPAQQRQRQSAGAGILGGGHG